MQRLFSFFPFLLCKVTGTSMFPLLKPNGRILVQKKYFFCNIKQDDIVALHDPRTKKLIVKRVKEIRNCHPEQREGFFSKNKILRFTQNDREYFILGDNPPESTDSRTFGWVKEKNIVGKVIYQINL